jgi:hypothetical protein
MQELGQDKEPEGASGDADCRGRLVMTDIPRGKYIGERVGNLPANEAEHFFK